MKRFKVVCIGYEKPSKEKIKELLRFEESWLESFSSCYKSFGYSFKSRKRFCS